MTPVITIGIVNYNYGKFIAKAIDSVLAQKISYSYELLIADDASTDNSREIINKYIEKYPEKIRPVFNENNSGPVTCAWKLISNSKGKYITWLDADDYWTYENKLQEQIDFLESHPEYTGCFHDADIINETEDISYSQSLGTFRYYSQFNRYNSDFNPWDLLDRNILPTAALVFRNRDFSDFFRTYNLHLHSFSWAFQLEIIKGGKFRYFNQCWSAYLDHTGGLSKKLSSESFSLNNIKILKRLKKDSFYRRYRNLIWKSIAHEYDCIVYKEGRIKTKYAFKSQCSYFRVWWWTAWYYKLDFLKKLFS